MKIKLSAKDVNNQNRTTESDATNMLLWGFFEPLFDQRDLQNTRLVETKKSKRATKGIVNEVKKKN